MRWPVRFTPVKVCPHSLRQFRDTAHEYTLGRCDCVRFQPSSNHQLIPLHHNTAGELLTAGDRSPAGTAILPYSDVSPNRVSRLVAVPV